MWIFDSYCKGSVHLWAGRDGGTCWPMSCEWPGHPGRADHECQGRGRGGGGGEDCVGLAAGTYTYLNLSFLSANSLAVDLSQFVF